MARFVPSRCGLWTGGRLRVDIAAAWQLHRALLVVLLCDTNIRFY